MTYTMDNGKKCHKYSLDSNERVIGFIRGSQLTAFIREEGWKEGEIERNKMKNEGRKTQRD